MSSAVEALLLSLKLKEAMIKLSQEYLRLTFWYAVIILTFSCTHRVSHVFGWSALRTSLTKLQGCDFITVRLGKTFCKYNILCVCTFGFLK